MTQKIAFPQPSTPHKISFPDKKTFSQNFKKKMKLHHAIVFTLFASCTEANVLNKALPPQAQVPDFVLERFK